MHHKIRNALILIAAPALSTASNTVLAHDGHGLAGSHWHATDVLGFVLVGGLLALAIWFARRGK